VIVMGTVQMLAMPSSHALHGRREVLAPMIRETPSGCSSRVTEES
jgi:hypothetical protein